MSKIYPGVKIVLDKERTLLLNLNAMATFEEVTGKSLFKGIDIGNMGARELRALLWASLIHEDKTLTLEQVGEWVNPQNMTDLTKALDESVTNAVAEKKEGAETDPLPLHPNG